jgi:L-threonylcarbamoyladenylate synthase
MTAKYKGESSGLIMSTILSVNHPEATQEAKRIIQNHGVIVFPTDTIYGIASDAFSPEGIKSIFKIKQRPASKALPVLIGDYSQLELLTSSINEKVQRIMQAFWPGPLTIILAKSPVLPAELSPHPTIGIRMPDLQFTRQLLRESGPLATTSANLSGGSNPVSVKDVIEQLGDEIDLILDGGPTPGPAASTVIDATGSELMYLREGPIKIEDLEALWKDD